MSIGIKRKEIEDAILDILQTNIPDVSWVKIFKGFQREKGMSGSIVNDHIDFQYDAKNQCLATATYTIIIADPDNTETVDTTADEVFELLDNDNLDGKAIIGDVKSIAYAAAPNKANAGAALLVYEVKYYV